MRFNSLQMRFNFVDAILVCTAAAGIGIMVQLLHNKFVNKRSDSTQSAKQYVANKFKYERSRYDTELDTCSAGCLRPTGCAHCADVPHIQGVCGPGHKCVCIWCTYRVPDSVCIKFPNVGISLCAATNFTHDDCPICIWRRTRGAHLL